MPSTSKGRIVVILQARMGSTRLPGKVLKKILGKELLSYQLERLKRSKLLDQIVVATTIRKEDEQVVEFCKRENVSIYQGSEEDVLDRYFHAAKEHKADIIVRVTGDCPLIDPVIVDEVITTFLHHKPPCDYLSNSLKRTYPRGLDVEVFTFQGLEICHKQATLADEKEHVTPYFYLHPEKFVLGSVISPVDLSKHRWTVDTEEDFELVSRILREIYPKKPNFLTADVLKLLEEHTDWMQINSHILQKRLDSEI